MNKQKLIKKIGQFFTFGSRDYIERDRVLDLVEQLDEPEKVTIPQFVADYIEFQKKNDFHVYGCPGMEIQEVE